MQFPLYLVIGACNDTIIVHQAPETELILVEVWTPFRTRGMLSISSTVGNILEIKSKTSLVWPSPGDIVIPECELDKLWYINKYLRGDYNSAIKAVMDSYSVTNYRLPKDYTS